MSMRHAIPTHGWAQDEVLWVANIVEEVVKGRAVRAGAATTSSLSRTFLPRKRLYGKVRIASATVYVIANRIVI